MTFDEDAKKKKGGVRTLPGYCSEMGMHSTGTYRICTEMSQWWKYGHIPRLKTKKAPGLKG